MIFVNPRKKVIQHPVAAKRPSFLTYQRFNYLPQAFVLNFV